MCFVITPRVRAQAGKHGVPYRTDRTTVRRYSLYQTFLANGQAGAGGLEHRSTEAEEPGAVVAAAVVVGGVVVVAVVVVVLF